MKIAIVSEGYYPEISGVTTSLDARARKLAELGHEVRIYAPDYAPIAAVYPNYKSYIGELFPNVTIVPFPSRSHAVEYLRDARPFSCRQVAKDMDSFAPDVIHTECPERLFTGFLSRPGVKYAKRANIPRTAIYHTNYIAYIEDFKKEMRWLYIPGIEAMLRKLMIWVYNSYDVTMVPTRETERDLRAYGIKNTRLGCFYGVDIDRFHARAANCPPAYESLQGYTKILYVGRLTPDKNIDDLLIAFSHIRQKHQKVKFIFIGDGLERDRIKAWAEAYDDTLLLGRIAPDKISPYFIHADILATASAKENRPLTILEAMASGIPVVAPAAGGIKDQIVDGETGLLTPPYAPQKLADAISRLLTDEHLYRRIRANARAAVLSQSWENAASEMLAVWEGLINGRLST